MKGLLTLALVGLMVTELAHIFLGLAWMRSAAHLAFGAVILTALPRLGFREAYLLALSAVLAALLWYLHPEPWVAARHALDQAVFLTAFILLLSLVQEAAMTSPSVAEVGTYLSRQPGGRRFVGLYGGTNLMAVIFNLGTMTLIAPVIRRAAEEAPDDPLTPIRERRQLSAVLRGFAWCVVWSPTAVAPLALLTLIDGIDRPRWMAIGFGLAVAMLIVGWAEDRWRWRNHTAAALGLPPVKRASMPVPAVLRFAGVCLSFVGLTIAILTLGDLGVPSSIMAAAPLLLLGWLVAQRIDLLSRLRHIADVGLPASAPAAVTLGCSGFVGIAGAALIPAETVAEWLGIDAMPAWIFMLAITVGVALFAQFALSPIMMAVFFGAILGSLPSLPAEPTLTALAIAAGWALSMTCAPFASVVIMINRITGHAGTELTYRWNTGFTLLALAVLAATYLVLTGAR
ncbi:MAG: hypothetical protein AAGK00_10255 [Pseudomonadota bacterium]